MTLSATNPHSTWRKWLNLLMVGTAVFVLLIVTSMAVGPWLIDSTAVKSKIQEMIAEKTGSRLYIQRIDFSYWPRPAIELRQVSLTLPDRSEATVAALHLYPKILPLLKGALHPARFELENPQFTLNVPDNDSKKTPVPPYTFAKLQKKLIAAIKPFGLMIAGLKLQINNGRITINEGKQQNLVAAEGLYLQGTISPTGPNSVRASLRMELAVLNLLRNGRQIKAQDLNLLCNGDMADGRMTVKLEQLSLADPHLAISGDLTLAPTSPAITLNLSGADIDVDAARRAALALADEIAPVDEIFDYLRGGRVAQMDFAFQGETWSELDDLKNVLIRGHLQDGKIFIPEIELDLTEVSGNVTISEAILQGSGVSARMDKSTGRDGSLQIGLARAQDIFKLELTLNADLADTHSILQRVLPDDAFKAELNKINNLKGTTNGILILGDDINNIRTKFEISDLHLTADYQRVPLPVAITRGQIVLDGKRLDLSQLQGTLGQSTLDDLSCLVTWDKELFLDIGSGHFDLNLGELYPWLITLEGMRNKLQKVKQLTGQVQLSDFTFKGVVDRPSDWQFTSSGMVKNISAKTSRFTEPIDFTGGTFKVEKKQLTFDKLHAAVLDTAVTATGTVTGFPDQPDRIDLSLEGRLGSRTVTGLSEALTVPELYALRTPLDLQHTRITWQPDSTASFKGDVVVANGPMLTMDVDYLSGQFQIHQLDIKDPHSDARMVLEFSKDSQSLTFAGTLQNETLGNIFVNPQFASGRLEGDFSVTIPQAGPGKVLTTGQLTGENLPSFLLSGNKVHFEKINLRSDGPNVKLNIPTFTWKNLVWEPIAGTLILFRDRADITLDKAKLCGIDTIGSLSYTDDALSVDMTVEGKDLDVATSYNCLTEGRVRATGSLNLFGKLSSHGKITDLIRALRGPLSMTLSDGVVEQSSLAASTLEILNVTEIFKGRLPDFASAGLAYKTVMTQGQFENGTWVIDKFYMAGETLDLFGTGKINLVEKTVEGQLLAAPLKTVDTVLKYVPGVNYLLGGTLVSIPVSITGSLADPQVEILAASAVSSSLYNMAERTIKSPVRLLEEVIPREHHTQDESTAP